MKFSPFVFLSQNNHNYTPKTNKLKQFPTPKEDQQIKRKIDEKAIQRNFSQETISISIKVWQYVFDFAKKNSAQALHSLWSDQGQWIQSKEAASAHLWRKTEEEEGWELAVGRPSCNHWLWRVSVWVKAVDLAWWGGVDGRGVWIQSTSSHRSQTEKARTLNIPSVYHGFRFNHQEKYKLCK